MVGMPMRKTMLVMVMKVNKEGDGVMGRGRRGGFETQWAHFPKRNMKEKTRARALKVREATAPAGRPRRAALRHSAEAL